LDSLNLYPKSIETDVIKEEVFKILKNIYATLYYPKAAFHIGDTIANDKYSFSIVDIKLNMDSHNLYNGNRDSIADLNVDYRLQSE
jgi:hypothetical protein